MSNPKSKLCDICGSFKRNLPIRKFRGQSVEELDSTFTRLKIPFQALEQSALSCHTCHVLQEGITGCLEKHNHQSSEIRVLDFEFKYYLHHEDFGERDCRKLITLHFGSLDEFKMEFFAIPDDDCPCPEAWDDVWVSQRTTSQTQSDEAYEKIQEWLAECTDEHEYCTETEIPLLPTRVIAVGPNNTQIKLFEPRNERDSYVCLSHCWGSQQIITTTTATLTDRKQRILPAALSKTFLDAIELTRWLGYHYIWIDSLCILQDSAQDWATESPKMSSIYAHATLTLAATSSSSGAGGFYRPTPDFELSGTTPEGEPFTLFFRKVITHSLMHDPNLDADLPLLSRAWVFQERLLSPRVLHFGPQELFFECRSAATCECTAINGNEIALPAPKIHHAQAYVPSDDDGVATPYFLARCWRSLVAQYATLRLTYGSDRLPAFGGLAKHAVQQRKCAYYAGLWGDSLVDDLCWSAGGQGVRPGRWRAPSWSWAGVDNAIYYHDAFLFWDEADLEQEQEERVCLSEVVECTCVPAGGDGYGELKSAVLRLEGPCIEGVLMYGGDGEVSGAHLLRRGEWTATRYIVRLEQGEAFEIEPDYALEQKEAGHVPSGTRICCILLVEQARGRPRFIGLVLKAEGSVEGSFERIGSLRTNVDLRALLRNGWLEERRLVSIV